MADVQAIPVRDGEFDVVLAMHMLYHAPDLRTAVAELRRVLRECGALLASTNSRDHLRELVNLFAEAGGCDPSHVSLARSTSRFSLQDGDLHLRGSFVDVEYHPFPRRLVVSDPSAVTGYAASMRRVLEPMVRPEWDVFLARLRDLAAGLIARDGSIRIAARAGVFVCR